MQKTTNYQLPRWEKTDRILMDDFNGMTAALAAKGNCRIQAGSYTGTWTWGEDGKNTIACSGVPLLLCVLAAAGEGASVAADDSVKLGGYLVLRREQGTVTDRTYDCALKEQQSLFASRNLMTAQEGDSK